MTSLDTLRRLESHPIDLHTAECRVIVVTRNEALRLPWFLAYYRSLGVSRFFVIDNGSEDNSVEFLLQQKDCHVFSTQASYAAAGFGVAWQKLILKEFTGNHWWLIVDADEILVYPSSETVSLPNFCRYLDSIGAEGLYTLLLDMYSPGPVAAAVYKTGQPFIDVCPCYDSEYRFQARLKAPFAPNPFPRDEPIGGPRLRRFYPEYLKAGREALARAKIFRRMRDLLRRFGIPLNIDCAVPPILFKVPLLKGRPELSLINSHMIEPLRLAPVTGALLHFKFFADFHERVMREANRREHFDGASEYARYLKVLESEPHMTFYYDKTKTYENTGQLVKLGLITDDASFAAARSGQAKGSKIAAM